MKITLELTNVDVRFPQAGGSSEHVLKNVSLRVREGEFVVLIGRSGCGKTTILNVASGLVEPTGGSCTVLGTSPRIARSQLGYMFARDALMAWRTALQNVALALELRQVSKREHEERARHYLGLVGLEAYAHKYPHQLSQGMRQRVALARTWAAESSLMLMDEPFAALDADTKEDMHRQLLRIWEARKRSVLFVTHDLSEALTLADRIMMVRNGEIAEDIPMRFPRPRHLDELRMTPDFQNLYQRIRASLS